MCGAGGHDPQGITDANDSNDDAPVYTLPAHLYAQLTDAHCHIQDDRESIRALVESWSNSTTPSDETSSTATPLLTGKVCLMGVQPSKDLRLQQDSNNSLAGIEANTVSLSLTSNSLSRSSAPIVTVSWSDTDVQGDWDLVAKLAETHPDRFVPCFGIHPWFTHKYKLLEGSYKGSTIELRGVSNSNSNNASGALESSSGATAGTGTGAEGAAGAGSSSDSPSLSFSSAFLTPVPGPGIRREAFLAMSKQLQEQMAKESREREGDTQQVQEKKNEATTDKHATNAISTMVQEAPAKEKDSTTSINVTIPNADDARFSHYKTVLSLPTSVSEAYLTDLAKRLPTPRALEPALKELRRQLEAHPHAILGEIGLDRTARVPEPSFVPLSSTPEETTSTGAGENSAAPTTTSIPQKRITLALTSIQHQLDIVREQLKLAAALDRPVSFHCVQAYGHWHDFLIQEGRRLRQLEADQEYQIQLQQIQASGGTIPLLPPTAMNPTGVRLSKRSTARLKREARDAAWERHVASTLQESSDEEDDSDGGQDQDDSDGEQLQQRKAKAETAADSKEVHFNEPTTTATDTTVIPTPAAVAIPQPTYEPVLPPRLCMHSYGGSVDMLKAFTKLDHPPEIYFSFSILINGRLQERKLKELILAVPEDRLLIESDHHSHNHVDQLLVEMVLKVAEIRKWSVEETVERTARNWRRFVYGDNHLHD